jgi:hypothetical protein
MWMKVTQGAIECSATKAAAEILVAQDLHVALERRENSAGKVRICASTQCDHPSMRSGKQEKWTVNSKATLAWAQ